jgi:prepilin-type N-terminal cleavage/methylation domain-containing protein
MKRRAFTLIELLITIAIIGVLTSMASLAYSGITQRSRDAQRINDLNQVKIALTSYYNVQLPLSYVVTNATITIDSSTDALSVALEPNFIKNVPLDPINSGNNVYKYASSNAGKSFTLYGTLENTNNKKGWGGGNAWVQDGLQVTDN